MLTAGVWSTGSMEDKPFLVMRSFRYEDHSPYSTELPGTDVMNRRRQPRSLRS